MKLILISPPGDDDREMPALSRMLSHGLNRYHLRKPGWSTERLDTFLSCLSVPERLRIVLHGQAELVEKWNLLGRHWSDNRLAPVKPPRTGKLTSRACHDVGQLAEALGYYDSVLLSPVFLPLSKSSDRPVLDLTEVGSVLSGRSEFQRQTEVIALGGIQESTTKKCGEQGFDGVAAHGAIWRSEDPVAAFVSLQRVVAAEAGSIAHPPTPTLVAS